MCVDFPIISAVKRVKYRHSIRIAVGQGWGYNIVYICAHTIVDISVLLNGTQWGFYCVLVMTLCICWVNRNSQFCHKHTHKKMLLLLTKATVLHK